MKKVTINTKLDGPVEFTMMDKEDFAGRINAIYTFKSVEDLFNPSKMEKISESKLPDDVILCDFCNEQITEFPVPVMASYALCPVCFADVKAAEPVKPICKLIGNDSNVYAIIGSVKACLRHAGQHERAEEFAHKALHESESYDAVLALAMEYVEVK